ncbi:MAG: YceI family protein [Pseudomonadota bacterium]
MRSTGLIAVIILSLFCATAAKAVNWRVLPGGLLEFSIRVADQRGESFLVTGDIPDWQAWISFDTQDPDATQVCVAIDLSRTQTDRAGFDAEMHSDTWLGTAAHPQAVFSAARAETIRRGQFISGGILELRGHSAPVDVRFTLFAGEGQVHVTGSALLDRRAFRIGSRIGASSAGYDVLVTFSFDAEPLASSTDQAGGPANDDSYWREARRYCADSLDAGRSASGKMGS